MPSPLGVVASGFRASTVPLGWVDAPATASNALRQQPDDSPVIDDLIIVARLAMNGVPGSGNRTICERWVTSATGTNRFILRLDASARPVLLFAQAGATQTRTATVAWPFATAQWGWLRTTLDVDNGAGQHVVRFETAPDGTTWTVLDTVTTAGVASVDPGAGSLAVANRYFGSAIGLNGKVADLVVSNASAVLFEMHCDADLRGVAVDASAFTATSGHTVTVARSGSPALVLVPPP
jgi:hypothetical protein